MRFTEFDTLESTELAGRTVTNSDDAITVLRFGVSVELQKVCGGPGSD